MNFLSTSNPEARKKAFDALEEYGNNGINMINELMGITIDEDVKMHGFEAIKRIKSKIDKPV